VAKRGLSDTSNKGLQYAINQNIKITISKGYNCAKKVYIAPKIAPSDRNDLTPKKTGPIFGGQVIRDKLGKSVQNKGLLYYVYLYIFKAGLC